jgi:hypothetical protein
MAAAAQQPVPEVDRTGWRALQPLHVALDLTSRRSKAAVEPPLDMPEDASLDGSAQQRHASSCPHCRTQMHAWGFGCLGSRGSLRTRRPAKT